MSSKWFLALLCTLRFAALSWSQDLGRWTDCEYTEKEVVQLYQTLRSPLRWYGYRILGSSDDAEDLVQVAFLKAFDQLKRQGQIQNPRSWLYRIVHQKIEFLVAQLESEIRREAITITLELFVQSSSRDAI